MRLYFIVTTSLIEENYEKRKEQYCKGIDTLFEMLKLRKIEDIASVIIVENTTENGKPTFLDKYNKKKNCVVFYTRNHFLNTKNKGIKELYDVRNCIEKFNIRDNDFIVKMTGRYLLDLNNSPFFDALCNMLNSSLPNQPKYEAIIKYGWFGCPSNVKQEDCITGLIGMTAKNIMNIVIPMENECVEWKWAKQTFHILDEKIFKLTDNIGVYNVSLCNEYHLL